MNVRSGGARTSIRGLASILLGFFVLPTHAADATKNEFADLQAAYTNNVRPLLQRYCHDCHSPEKHKGDLDLTRFNSAADAQGETRPWEKVLEMLGTGEMPPKEKPQPAANERDALQHWVKDLLAAASLERAGDPGRVLLRRLSNVEYTLTIRDLTGVALDPAREFPVDGAAGEGFVNTGEALVMSPALLEKYFAAAKDIASHAVLLPDGFRFSAGARRGDWIDERLADIRRFYARYTDAEGGTQINLQGIKLETNTGGRLPIERYLAATLRHRQAIAEGRTTLDSVARECGLNTRYLNSLWTQLSGGDSSLLLEPLRSRWRAAGPDDANALAAYIFTWQAALSKFQTVGHMKPWIVPLSPLTPRQELLLDLAPPTNSTAVSIYLIAGDAGDGNDHDLVVWRQPRLVIPGRPDLPLRDARRAIGDMIELRTRLFGVASRSLAAAAEVEGSENPPDRADLARRHGIESELLTPWFDYLGIGTGVAPNLALFTNQIQQVANHDFVKGWGSPDTPNLVANASDQHVRIPGNLEAHGVALHPSPKLNAVVGWRSPITGAVRVAATVTHAHPECGNGVTWSLELRRGATRQPLAAGIAEGSNPVNLAPIDRLRVQRGDLLFLAIGPRDGNHACDLTAVDLVLTSSDDGLKWNLRDDVAGDVLAGNPHPDGHGNPAVWNFYTEPVTEDGGTSHVIPAGSILARWRSAESDADRNELAAALERMLRDGTSPPADSPDFALYRQLTSLGGPLLTAASSHLPDSSDRGSEPAPSASGKFAGIEKNPDWGPDPSLFGRHPDGGAVEAGDLCLRAPAVLEVRLPADLAAGCALVTTGVLLGDAAGDASVQLELAGTPPKPAASPLPGVPILVQDGSPARRRFETAFHDFRRWFPAALCYPKIVPVDEVITLTVFHRDDEPLCRLMLDEKEKAGLDRMWDELHYIGQDALSMEDAFAQLMEYATQDGDPKQFEPLRRPIRERAQAFRSLLDASEARHLDALVKFAERAFRRPIPADDEAELRSLYASLRRQDLSHDEAFRLVLARVLVSPSFLYRIEQPAPGDQPEPVSPWELASRLSYFLWSSMPDDALRQRAASGHLQDPDELVAEARRLIQDARVRALATEFACQWLHIRDFDTLDEKSERHFPTFTELRSDMYEESIRFFVDLFQRDGSILEILDANHTFLNGPLAEHYGIPGIAGPEWRRVEDIQSHGRGGVLGFAAVLAKESGASRTSPILRGNWVVETLLGEKLPKPPPNVPLLPENESDTGELTMRQVTERHSGVPECAVCHVRIDPFGYALEAYDAIGRRRDKDLAGRDLNTRSHLTWKDDATFEDLAGLRQYLVTRRGDAFLRTFCRKFLGYALGRALTLSDQPLLDGMAAQLRSHDHHFSAALETVLRSRQFREQRGLEATKEDAL